jgi:hypothetical protein
MARRSARGIWFGLSCVVAISWWLVFGRAWLQPDRPQLHAPVVIDAPLPPRPGSPARAPLDSQAPAPQTPEVPSRPPAARVCEPRAAKACNGGDVFWFDSCGRATDRVEACGGRRCLGISCAPARRREDRCGSVTAHGRCDGEVARACVGGEVVRVDCAQRGQRCVHGGEGVQCRDPSKDDCKSSQPDRCTGSRLEQCVDGQLLSIDCALRKAQCVEGDADDPQARCVTTEAKAPSAQVELCNQLDDDDDDRVDEDAVCEGATLVAVVADGATLTDLAQRMHDELAILNRIYAPLTFRWGDLVSLPAGFARFPSRQMADAAQQVAAAVRAKLGAGFFIPVLFVQELDIEPPKSGIATLPNNRCGGVRVQDAPAPLPGLIVLADLRMPETLAHELGHYLGLCHTHDRVEQHAVLDREAPLCELSGDGICDTALDPGKEYCVADPSCTVYCAHDDARPEAENAMSYYLGCRRALSADQLREAERNLALRRGWSRCLDKAACACRPGEPAACPIEMSCRPERGGGENRFACELDGPALPGAPCQDSAQCSGGGLCLTLAASGQAHGRCARACIPGPTAGCDCVDLGLPFSVCREDAFAR